MQLLEQLHHHSIDHPERLALREPCTGKAINYRQLDTGVTDFASVLRARLTEPSTVLVKISNRIDFVIAFLAGLSAGHAVFPVPTDLADAELCCAAKQCRARALITSNLKVEICPDAGQSCVAERALLLQSSGTTGLPKIVCRPAAALDASARQMCQAVGFRGEDQILMCVPLSHSYGLEHGLLAPIFAGSSVHLVNGFDLNLIRRELAESGITLFPAVPPVFEMLPSLAADDARFPRLRLPYSAGGPLPISVNEAFHRQFGTYIAQLYGASEFGSVTFADPDAPHFDPGSVGSPMAGVELKLDADNQLHIRAQSMMRGYVGDESPLSSDEFFPTGDLARIDRHNNLTITGRLKLLIDVGGRKVNPLEVEQFLRQHPAVGQCVVVGIQQTQTVRRLKAVVTASGAQSPPNADDLRRFLRGRISAYKIPRIFEFRDSLPTSSAGKVLRHLVENE